MKTLKESLLDKTMDKVGGVKDSINPIAPKNKDWKSDGRHTKYIDYYCPELIQKYINLIDDDYFYGSTNVSKQANPFRLKKESLTRIRCIINTSSRPCHTSVELCNDTFDHVGMGVNILGASQYCNDDNVASAKKKIIQFFEQVQTDSTPIINMFKRANTAYGFTVRDGYYVDGHCIWDFLKTHIDWSK